MRLYSTVLCLITLLTSSVAQGAPGDLFSPDLAPEKVYADGRFTEGADVAPDGTVYFADVAVPGNDGGRPSVTLRFDPRTRTTTVINPSNGNTNGQKFDPQGRLLSVQTSFGGTRDLVRTDLATGRRTVVATGYGGKPFNALNDLTLDRGGRIYATDVRLLGSEPIEQPTNGVYRVDPNGRVTRLISELRGPNGVAVSPDGRTLYVAEHPYRSSNLLLGDLTMLPMSLRAYPLRRDGSVGQGRVFVDFGRQEGVDGMVVDARGNIFATYRDDSRRGVRVFSPRGVELDFLPLPEKPTNVAFGRGRDASTLYVTAGKSLYRVHTRTVGHRF